MPTLSTASFRNVFSEAMPKAQHLWKTFIIPPLSRGSIDQAVEATALILDSYGHSLAYKALPTDTFQKAFGHTAASLHIVEPHDPTHHIICVQDATNHTLRDSGHELHHAIQEAVYPIHPLPEDETLERLSNTFIDATESEQPRTLVHTFAKLQQLGQPYLEKTRYHLTAEIGAIGSDSLYHHWLGLVDPKVLNHDETQFSVHVRALKLLNYLMQRGLKTPKASTQMK
jgi:hypothetical protein